MLNDKKICGPKIKFEVINMGVYGYNMEYIVERFIRRGIKYQPDFVVLLLNPGNLEKINEKMLPVFDQLMENGEKNFDVEKEEYIGTIKAMDIIQEELGLDYITDYK